MYVHTYVRMCMHEYIRKYVCTYVCTVHYYTVSEVRSKWLIDTCPSIIILNQTISALLRQMFEHTVQMTW